MTMRIECCISTSHMHPACVAGAIRADHLLGMESVAGKGVVLTKMSGTRLRSVIASVDDYLMNLAVAEDVCWCNSD